MSVIVSEKPFIVFFPPSVFTGYVHHAHHSTVLFDVVFWNLKQIYISNRHGFWALHQFVLFANKKFCAQMYNKIIFRVYQFVLLGNKHL